MPLRSVRIGPTNAQTLRWMLLALWGVSAGAFVYTMIVLGGNDGVTLGPAAGPHRLTIAVENGSPAYGAGLRSGDVIDLRSATRWQRWRYASLRNGGETQTYYVVRDGRTATVPTTVRPYTSASVSLYDWLADAGGAWFLLFSIVLLVRRSAGGSAIILGTLLACWTLGSSLWRENIWIPWPVLSAALDVANKLFNVAAIVLSVVYVLRFSRRDALLRAVTAVVYVFCAAHVGLGVVEIVAIFGGIAPLQALSLPIEQACYASALAAAALCIAVALPRIPRETRASVAWATVPLAVVYAFEAAAVVSIALFPEELFPQYIHPADIVSDISVFLAPVVLTYAVFSRRVIDIGFLLNRAAIFSGVSIITLGVFVLVEWLLSDWFRSESHSTSVIVTGALALSLGFSLKFIHARVEHFVDSFLFHKRREDTEALDTFAREVPYITDGATLLSRAQEVLYERTDASSVTIALKDGNGRYGAVDENDPAIVSLRARHDALDLHKVRTALNGELAYPMIARGRLIGTVILGARRSGETYAPDESGAVYRLAQSVASTLDALSAREPSRDDAILQRLDALTETVTALVTATRYGDGTHGPGDPNFPLRSS